VRPAPSIMIRFFFVRLILPLLFVLFVSRLIRAIVDGFKSAYVAQRRPPAPTVSPGGELKKDPVCGTYVSTSTGISKNVGGQTIYFCSEECRKKYRVA
jgi:YHS domain-containing protein